MAIGVRDYLENLGHTVGYDQKSGDVLVDNEKGQMKSIGSGFTLKDDGRYYADSEQDILDALSKSNISPINGYSPLRNTLSGNNAVGYNDKTGQVYINGRDYNVDGQNLVKVGSTVYGKNDFLDSVSRKEYKNKYEDLQKEGIEKLLNSKYEGYNPEDDESYKAAYDAFITEAKADMGSRGMISDSLATHYAAQGAAKLMPYYAEMDYERYLDEQESVKDALSQLAEFDQNDRQAYTANAEITQREQELLHSRERDAADTLLKEAEIEAEAKEAEAERDFKREQQEAENEAKRELLEREYTLKSESDEQNFYYEQELKRLQSDLDISKAQAQAYYKAIYG